MGTMEGSFLKKCAMIGITLLLLGCYAAFACFMLSH